MVAQRNVSVSLHCEVCAKPFHPWFGREKTSRVCGLSCNGALTKAGLSYDAADFDKFVKKSPGCWEWVGLKNDSGYGIFNIQRQRLRAHRFSYERAFGPIPTGLAICHKCDNPACVRPDHLFAGSHKDNMTDMASKKRAHRGPSVHSDAHPLSKITAQIARAIRVDVRTHQAIADSYGVSRSLVRGIKCGTHWKYA